MTMKTAATKKIRSRNLTNYELETVINFNEQDTLATIFTYNMRWQKRLEQGMGIKPQAINDSDGRTYELPKTLIPLPRAKRQISEERKASLRKTLATARQNKRANGTD